MNLLNQHKTFEFFPALNLNSLADRDYAQVNLMSCNMQIPSLKKFEDNKIILETSKNRNKKYYSKSKKSSANSVDLNGDLYFYTGLKEYYKVNVKNEILSEYFVEQQKNLLFLDKQKRKRSEYLSGDVVFPMNRSYEYNKRRFILGLHTRDHLNTKENLVEPFAHIINDLNYTLLGSLLLTVYKSKSLPKLNFYKTGKGKNNSGNLYHFMGIERMFMHWKSVPFQYHFISTFHKKYHKPREQKRQLIYLLKYLPNRQYFLLQYLFTNLHNNKLNKIIDTDNFIFLRKIICEFMAIKFFLRFYLLKSKVFYKKRIFTAKFPRMLKSLFAIFNSARVVYKNVFEYVFNLCALQSFFATNKYMLFFNALNLNNIYYYNTPAYKISLFSFGFAENGGRHQLHFRNFMDGLLTKQRGPTFKKTPFKFYRFLAKLKFYNRDIINTRYRNAMVHRRYNLLIRHNPLYLFNKLKERQKEKEEWI